MYASAPLWEEFYRRLESKAQSLIDPATGRVAAQYVEPVLCPLCGSSSFAPRVLRDGFQYVTCTSCAFVYLNPQLTQQAVRDVYNDEDVRKFFFEQLLLPHVERDQRGEFTERARVLKSLTPEARPRLLDIGCAAGNFLMRAGEEGFIGEGLELNQLYVDYMAAHRKIKVQARLLEEMKYPDETFDVVTLWDVLEHLPKPVETLKEVGRVMRRGGILGLTTINHACVNETILKDRWRYYMPPDHLCSFTPALLEMLLKKCGFTIVKIEHHYMLEVLADHYASFLKPSAGGSGISNKIKKMLYLIFASTSQAVFNTMRSGDLVTVYARKS